MRITGSGNLFPSHVVRAYGVLGAKAMTPPAGATQSIGKISPAATPVPSPATHQASGVRSLVAGQVPGPITFNGVSVPRTTQGVFHMYTRAADKIEAATAVQIGRTLDIKG